MTPEESQRTEPAWRAKCRRSMMVLAAVTHDARLRGQIHPVSRCGKIHHSEEGIGELIIL
jgi:hypothetical protein